MGNNDDKTPEIRFDVGAITAPILRASRDSVEVIALALKSIASADLSIRPDIEAASGEPIVGFDNGPRDPVERRQAYTNWLLAKGFQDLARGIHDTLKEAFLYVELFPRNGTSFPVSIFETARRTAATLSFPGLLKEIERRLSMTLHFSDQLNSIQQVRNCLEHRSGIVGDIDLDNTDYLRLTLPRWQLIGIAEGKEFDLVPGYVTVAETRVALKRENRERIYKRRESISILPEEFGEIAHSCWLLAQDIVAHLPRAQTS